MTNVRILIHVFIQFDCCGLEGYEDFKRGDSQWFGEDVAEWKTPVSCCKTLPKTSGSFQCAKEDGHDAAHNNFNKVC